MAGPIEELVSDCIDNNESFIVEAGAGSGKTWSLVQALFYIINTNGDRFRAKRSRIACITYTNVAKEEIIERTYSNELIDVKTIHDFLWNVIKPFQKELKQSILDMFKDKISQQQIIVDNSAKAPKRKAEAVEKIERYTSTVEELQVYKGKIQYKEYSNRKKGIISHDDVIELAGLMLKNYDNLLKLVQDMYPVIFIDEYQDTNKDIAEVLLGTVKLKTSILFGLFGDYSQQIYNKSIGKVDSDKYAIKKIPKDENYRCSVEVINLLNKFRSDIQQTPTGKEKHGKCLCYYVNNTDLDTEKYLDETICLDFGVDEKTIKRLYLVTKSIAKRNGYLELHDLYDEENKQVEGRRAKRKDQLLKNKDNRDCPFSNHLFDIEELVEFYKTQNIQKLLKKTAYGLYNVSDKIKLHDLMDKLIEISATASIGEIYRFVWDNGLLEQPGKIKRVYDDETLQDDFYNTLLNLPYKQFINLYYTVKKTSPFSTDHGTKGTEFDNVVCFVDDADWSNSYNFNNYFDYSDDGKVRYQKTNNIFYVICSRARYNLAVVILSALNGKAIDTLKNLFGEDNFIEEDSSYTN